MRAHPVHQTGQPRRLVQRHGSRDELGLVAQAMRRDDQALRDLVGHARAVIAAHKVQHHVEPGRRARGREQLAFVDVQRIWAHVDFRIAGLQQIGIAPVRRRRLAVKQAGRREQEHARADGGNSGAASVGGGEASHQRLRRRHVCTLPARNDDGVGATQHRQPVRHLHRDPACSTHGTALLGTDSKPVPVDPEFGSGEREHLHGAAELEGAQIVVGQRDDEMIFHVVILPMNVI